jgi:CRP-like cAMP-binding protein
VAPAAPAAQRRHSSPHLHESHRLARLDALLQRRRHAAGDVITSAGDAAAEIYLLIAGEVSVRLPLADGGRRRIATLTPVVRRARGARTRRAHRRGGRRRDVELAVLEADAFHALHDADPGLQAALLSNMLSGAYELVARATAEATARA